jgi:nucleoside diphosphate kinase
VWFEKTGKEVITDFAVKLEAPALLCKQRLESQPLPPQKHGDSTVSIIQRTSLTRSEDLPLLCASLERLGKLRVVPALVAEDACNATISGMLASRALIAPFERTLAMIKPDAVRNGFVADIISQISQTDLIVVHTKFVQFDSNGAQEFYAEHVGKSFFPNLEAFMTSGPAVVLILEGPEAVFRWRTLMGPTNTAAAKDKAPKSLRAQFGTDGTQNACHGSDSPFSAMREIDFWYSPTRGGGIRLSLGSRPDTHNEDESPSFGDSGVPRECTFGIIKPLFATVHCESILSLLYCHGFTVVSEIKRALTTEHIDFIYRDQTDLSFFAELRSFLSSGPVDLLMLERAGAIQALRYLIGPANVKKAKKDRPASLRSIYGIDSIKNVMHGSISTEDVSRCRQYFFTIGPVPEPQSKLSVHQGKAQATINAAMLEFPATYQMNALAKVSNRKRAKVPPPFSMQKFDYLADYLSSQVDPVIKELMTHLMQHRPTDVIAFAIKDLLEMQRENLRASTPDAANSPMRRFASSSPMKSSQSASALPPIGASNMVGPSAIPMPVLDGLDDDDLTPDVARNQIVRLKTFIDEITHNMQEMAVNSTRVDPNASKNDNSSSERRIGIIHMGDTYDFMTRNLPVFGSHVNKLSLDLRSSGSGDVLILHSGGFASGGPMLANGFVKDDLKKLRIAILNSVGKNFFQPTQC